MLIDIQLSVNSTKRLPIEFSVSKRKLFSSLMMTSILIVPEFSKILLRTTLAMPMDLFSAYLKFLKDSDRDFLSTSV